MSKNKLSLSYRILRSFGLNYPEKEYGNVSFFEVTRKFFKTYKDAFIISFFLHV